MRRPIPLLVSVLLPALAALAGVAQAANGDIRGARDYPGIERFAGSVITGYDAKDSDRTRLQTAPFKNGNATGDMRPEGRVTRIAYRTDPGPSIREVYSAFETQLANAGYETVFTCDADACGRVHFSQGLDVLFVPFMWVDGLNYLYLVGRKSGADGETWATVLVSHHFNTVTAQLVVTEVGASATR